LFKRAPSRGNRVPSGHHGRDRSSSRRKKKLSDAVGISGVKTERKALAEFERDIIRERTNAGLTAARARGRKGGRPKSPLSDKKKLQMARQLYENKTIPVGDIYKNLARIIHKI
jgi:hypothetical protein